MLHDVDSGTGIGWLCAPLGLGSSEIGTEHGFLVMELKGGGTLIG